MPELDGAASAYRRVAHEKRASAAKAMIAAATPMVSRAFVTMRQHSTIGKIVSERVEVLTEWRCCAATTRQRKTEP